MLSAILKLIPKMDSKELQDMQRQLQSRFTKIAKSFGKGIANAFKGGGIAGIALGLIDKILNPLKETQEAIDKMLKSSDDISTNAKQFNTTTGRLFKLVQLAKATGLDQDNLFQLMTKFQTAVAQAKSDPKDQSVNSVRNFTKKGDMAENFFDFINQLQKMDKNSQVLVQQQVFGEKQILKMADFLQSDFPKLMEETGLNKVSSQKFTESIESMAKLNDLKDVLAVRRESKDVMAKGGIITDSMIRAMDKSEQIALEKENARIKSFTDLSTLADTTSKIMNLVDTGVIMLGKLIDKVTPALDKMVTAIEAFMRSPMVRGVKGLFGGKDE